MTTRGPIDAYLDDLFHELRHHEPAAARRVLVETEDHLRESAARRESAGMEPLAAQQEAITAFGPSQALARSLPRARRTPAVSVSSLLMQFVLLAASGLLVAGLNGGLLYWMGTARGSEFVVGEDGFTTVMPIGPCAYQALPGEPPPASYNGGRDCTPEYLAALTDDARTGQFHSDVAIRLGAGVAGLVILGALLLLRWRLGRWPGRDAGYAVPFAGTAIFAALAVGLLFWGWDSDVKSIDGAGAYYAAGLAAAAGFVASLAWLLAAAGGLPRLARHRTAAA